MYEILKKYWGYTNFRDTQEEIIKNILKNKDCFVTLKTGGGKSLIYQVPSLIKSGTSIIISPLIALMEDQVNSLISKDIKAVYLKSNLLPSQEKEIYKKIKEGFYKLIYLSPEKLSSKTILNLLKSTNISMIVFDEAHCLNEWGDDFRPDYKRIAQNIKKEFNNIQVIALTATITSETKLELIKVLKMDNPFISTSSFDRKNIFLGVKKFWTILGKTKFLENKIKSYKKTLVYCSSREETEIMSEKINHKLKIKSSFYHAGCDIELRKSIQESFKTGEIKCLFATTAFGMGIDISDIDLVIYWNCASSIEEYYQGIGRAGRNENIKANSWVIYTSKDLEYQKRLINFEIPEKKLIENILKSLENNESVNKIKSKFKVSEILINSIQLIYESNFNLDKKDILKVTIQNLMKIKENKSNKYKIFKDYLKYSKCKRKFILNYFSENLELKCGNCSNCIKDLY